MNQDEFPTTKLAEMAKQQLDPSALVSRLKTLRLPTNANDPVNRS